MDKLLDYFIFMMGILLCFFFVRFCYFSLKYIISAQKQIPDYDAFRFFQEMFKQSDKENSELALLKIYARNSFGYLIISIAITIAGIFVLMSLL